MIDSLIRKKRLMNTFSKSEAGFSLLEIVTAVGVVLLLAIIGLFSYSGIVNNARQSAVNKAVDEIYTMAMSRAAGTDDGDPEAAGDEWEGSGSKNNQIRANVTSLGGGRYKVIAYYGEDFETSNYRSVRVTPLSGSNGETIVTPEGDTVTDPGGIVGTDLVSNFTFVCDENQVGRLPISNIDMENTKISISENGGEYKLVNYIKNTVNARYPYTIKDLNSPINSSERIFMDPTNLSEQISMKADVEYKVKVVGKFDTLADVRAGREDYTRHCLVGVDSLGEDSGVKTISNFTGAKTKKIMNKLPSSVVSLEKLFYGGLGINDGLADTIESWDVSNVRDLSSAFYAIKLGADLDLNNWDISSVETLEKTFMGAEINGYVGLNWDTSNVRNFDQTLVNLTGTNGSADINGWVLQGMDSLDSPFGPWSNYINGNINDWTIKNVGTIEDEFLGLLHLTGGNMNNWVFENVNTTNTLIGSQAELCGELNNWTFKNIKNMSAAFRFLHNQGHSDCYVTMNNWNITKVDNIDSMFRAAGNIQEMSGWKLENVSSMENMFQNAVLNGTDLKNWNLIDIKNTSGMFNNVRHNHTPDSMSGWTGVENIKHIDNMFEKSMGNKIPFNPDLSYWDLSNVETGRDTYDIGTKKYWDNSHKPNFGS